MKFLLYKPGTDDGSQGETASPGLGIIARSIKDAGHDVAVLDGELAPGITSTHFDYDIIGLSAVSLEARRAEAIRVLAQPRPVWLGGPHAFGYYDLLEHYDKIIVGDADGCIDEILNSEGRIVFPTPQRLVAPDYSNFALVEKMTAYSTYISRGCTNGCSFCTSGKQLRGKFRKRDLDGVREEFKEIKQYPNVKSINMIDDSFSADLEHAKTFLDWYVSSEFPYRLNVFNVRADQIDLELLGLMKHAGVTTLPIGVESGCDEVFRFVGKGEKLVDIAKSIEMIRDAGIVPWLNMIVGLPKDNLENNRKSIQWTKQFSDYSVVHWFQYTPYRRTRAYNWFVEQGAIKDGYIAEIAYGGRYDTLPWKPDFSTADFTADEREVAQLEAFLSSTSKKVVFSRMEYVENLCEKYGIKDLFDNWYVRKNAMVYFLKSNDGHEEPVHVVV